MSRQRILTGDRPTGKLHLGHYVGSLANRVRLQDEYECFFLIADFHALTTAYEQPGGIGDNVRELVLDYLSVGIDPRKSTIYLQSLAPEVAELATSLKMARGTEVPRALFTAALWTRLEHWLDVHAEQGFAPVREAWKGLCSTIGAEVLVKTEKTELKGVAEDIDENGALLVRLPNGTLERVLAADVEQLKPKKA